MKRIRLELIIVAPDDVAEELTDDVEGSMNEGLAVSAWLDESFGVIRIVTANVEVAEAD